MNRISACLILILLSFVYLNLRESIADITFFEDSPYTIPIRLTDPEEFLGSVRFVNSQKNNFSSNQYFELGFGGAAPISHLDLSQKSSFTYFVKGLIRSRFGFNTSSFDLFGADFFGGLSTLFIAPWDVNNKFEIFIYHQSSHLGDDYMKQTKYLPINYSCENISFSHFFDLVKNLDLSYSISYRIREDSVLSLGRAGVQLDARYSIPVFRRSVFAGLSIESKETYKWSPAYNLQLGFELSPRTNIQNKQYLIFEYFNGYSNFGQYYRMREAFFALSIIALL